MDFRKFSELTMMERAPFVLPLAYLGILFAGGGTVADWVWVGVAAIAARAVGMALNQVIDAEIDGQNPRTKDRLIPRGALTPRSVWTLAVAGSLVLMGSAYMLNTLCFYLSFAAILMLLAYTYVKRFSASYHFGLGLVQAAAPIGGYLAVSEEFALTPFILGFAVIMWVAGFDIIYALLDMDFDRKVNYHSVPASVGRKRTLVISIACYLLVIVALAIAGIRQEMPAPYWIGLAGLALVLGYEHSVIRNTPLGPAMGKLFRAHVQVSTTVIFSGTAVAVAI